MLKIAGIQMNSAPDRERNIEKASRMVEVAAGKGAKIVCLQELFSTPWFPQEINDGHFGLAEDLNGRTVTAMKRVSKDTGAAVIVPFFERNGDTYYNSAAVISSSGNLLGVYRKVHIPKLPQYEERHYFRPGNLDFPVFDTGIARIGVQISWDNLFPEGSRILALKGAQIIFSPTASAALASSSIWEKCISANAIANGAYIFRVNRVGKEAKQEFYGSSFCANPEGDMVGKPSGAQEGVVLYTIDLKMIDLVRKEWCLLKDRRPEMYQEITRHDVIGER